MMESEESYLLTDNIKGKPGHTAISRSREWAKLSALKKASDSVPVEDTWWTRAQAWKQRCKARHKQITTDLEIWRSTLIKIDGYFGSNVSSFFKFLKFLLLLDVYIFLLVFAFIVIPQFSVRSLGTPISDNTSSAAYSRARTCSFFYIVKDWSRLQDAVDFFQGTGKLEKTLLFYGGYSGDTYEVPVLGRYNLPLAYLFITATCLILSAAVMLSNTNQTLRQQVIQTLLPGRRGFSNMVFGGWDYTLSNPEMAVLRRSHLKQEAKALLAELVYYEKMRSYTRRQKCVLYLIRALVNLFLFLVLVGGGALIYFVTAYTTYVSKLPKYPVDYSVVTQIALSYGPSLTLTGLYALYPLLIRICSKVEQYATDKQISFGLIRLVFLRLSTLLFLLTAIYKKVECAIRNECGIGIAAGCTALNCWETYVGQQLYRLLWTVFLTNLFYILLVEFPRRLIAQYGNSTCAKKLGKPEFDVAAYVLELIHIQTVCWLCGFFAPMTTVMAILVLILLSYLMQWTVLNNYLPAWRPMRASRVNNFFMVVLILSFIITCVPIGYVMWKLSPSKGCGPFRLYDSVLQVLPASLRGLALQLYFILTSPQFLIPLVLLAMLLMYVLLVSSNTRGKYVRSLLRELLLSTKEKQHLAAKLDVVEAGIADLKRRRAAPPARGPRTQETESEEEDEEDFPVPRTENPLRSSMRASQRGRKTWT